MTPLISAYLLRHDDNGLGRPVKAGKCFVVNLGDCLEPSSNGDHEELCPCLCLWRVCFIIGGVARGNTARRDVPNVYYCILGPAENLMSHIPSAGLDDDPNAG
jgi:hypothetical protein